MTLSEHLAKHLRDVHFGGNWTVSSLKDALEGVSWQQATTQAHGFNTIATLVYHMHYYVAIQLRVLEGQPLEGSDKESFAHPPIRSEQDWADLQERVWSMAEALAQHIERLPDSQLTEPFLDAKYGTWYRNLAGNIEHMHYHLGQIVLIRKLVQAIQVPV